MDNAARSPAEGRMPDTRWTIIARLHSGDEKQIRRALDDLCAQYRYPLYCYIRRRGLNHHDAQDALHDFLAKLLRVGAFEAAEEEKGRLRSFLLTCLNRYLNTWSHRHDHRHEISIEAEAGLNEEQEQYQKERFTDDDSPDRIFERKWAQELMTGVMQHVRDKYAAAGKGSLFDALKPVLLSGGSLRGEDSAAIAESLGISGGTLRVALTRLLKDYRDMLESDVSQTVADGEKVAEEIAYLKRAFGK
jgi:RNA polymerase sigma factor (sigma-70 family)